MCSIKMHMRMKSPKDMSFFLVNCYMIIIQFDNVSKNEPFNQHLLLKKK